jgi:hypothetical protein
MRRPRQAAIQSSSRQLSCPSRQPRRPESPFDGDHVRQKMEARQNLGTFFPIDRFSGMQLVVNNGDTYDLDSPRHGTRTADTYSGAAERFVLVPRGSR